MFWTAVGDMLPMAIAIGMSPFAVITVVVLLMGEGGRRTASMFALGWFLTVLALASGAFWLIEAVEDSDPKAAADQVNVVQLVVGLAFLGLAWLATRKSAPDGEEAESKMVQRLTTVTPAGALGLGLLQGIVVVKNIPLAISGGARIAETLTGSDAVAALLVFGVLASSGMVGLIAASALGGSGFDDSLVRLRGWLEANMVAISVVVCVVIGTVLVGRGLAVLG